MIRENEKRLLRAKVIPFLTRSISCSPCQLRERERERERKIGRWEGKEE